MDTGLSMSTSSEYVRSDTLVLVQAFLPYADMVRRHLPLWQKNGGRVVITSPRDSFCEVPGAECVALGEEGHAGKKSLDRWKEILCWAAKQPERFVLMHESDSLCLLGSAPDYCYDHADVFFSNEMTDNAVPPTQAVYCLAPWFFSQDTLRRFLAAAEKSEYRFPYHGDRWVGQIVEEGRIPHRRFFPGMGCGTLRMNHLELDQMCEAIRNGGVCMVHGVKTHDVLDRVVAAYRERVKLSGS